MAEEQEQEIKKATDIDALVQNAEMAVEMFAEQWMPMPGFSLRTEVFDTRQLRDAMGLRVTQEAGDPWPAAEKLLLERGFRWHNLGGKRVMYLQERDDFIDTGGWDTVEEAD